MKLYISPESDKFRLWLEVGGITFNCQEGNIHTCESMKRLLIEEMKGLIEQERIKSRIREGKLNKRCKRKHRKVLLKSA